MESTQWDLAQQYDSAHASPSCTTSGTSKTCNFTVQTGGVSQLATILFGSTWLAQYNFSVTLA